MKIYTRNCPSCNRVLTTNNKYWNNKAIMERRRCLSCVNTGRVITDEWRENMRKNHANFCGDRNPFYGKHHTSDTKNALKMTNTGKDRFSDEYKIKLSQKMVGENNPFYGKHHSSDTIKKMSLPKTDAHKHNLKLALKGNPSPLKGKHHTDESKRKMRISAIKRISRMKFDGLAGS